MEKVADLQERVMTIRENITDKQRVLFTLMRSEYLPQDLHPVYDIMTQDLSSLIQFAGFLFKRIDYLQDTIFGMLNADQNRIIKIFTVMSVIFLPPTLIAGIYGMNFQFMPELNWRAGYPIAVLLMILSAVLPIIFFKLKKWL
jgi:magnesium transporter